MTGISDRIKNEAKALIAEHKLPASIYDRVSGVFDSLIDMTDGRPWMLQNPMIDFMPALSNDLPSIRIHAGDTHRYRFIAFVNSSPLIRVFWVRGFQTHTEQGSPSQIAKLLKSANIRDILYDEEQDGSPREKTLDISLKLRVSDEATIRRIAAERMLSSGFDGDPAEIMQQALPELVYQLLIGSNPDPICLADIGLEIVDTGGRQVSRTEIENPRDGDRL